MIKVLLKGLTGPLDGKTYRDVMVPMGGTDEWVAGIASYVRTSFGNSGGLVTPADVARVRAETAARKTPWTRARARSVAAAPARLAAVEADREPWRRDGGRRGTLRGWSSGAPQAPGMWFAVELPQPAVVTELQFDSIGDEFRRAGTRRRRRGRRPARGGRCRPVVGYPRGYSVQVSTDGTTWSKPVAEGKGDGAHTTITFAPTRAKFVRITQTDTAADAPAWSIRNLRIYEAPGGPATK